MVAEDDVPQRKFIPAPPLVSAYAMDVLRELLDEAESALATIVLWGRADPRREESQPVQVARKALRKLHAKDSAPKKADLGVEEFLPPELLD